MTLIEMKQERAKITNSIREIINAFENKEMDALKKEEMAKLEKDFDAINLKIENEDKQLNRERTLGEMAAKEKETSPKGAPSLFAKALSGDVGSINEYRNSYTLSTDATAGYLTAPVEFRDNLIRGLDDLLFMRQISTVIPGGIGAAQSLGFPYRKTNGTVASWTTEVVAAVEDTTLDFGRREFKPNKLAKLMKASRTLMNHAPMAEATLQREMQYNIGLAQESAYLTGNGTAQPLGIFTASASGISVSRDMSTGNTATAVTFDGLMNAKYNTKQQYMANASWIGHRDFAKMVAKIKDGAGNYIWQPSVALGTPDRLMNAPVYMSEYAPNTFTTGLYVAVYGDFKTGYWICDADAVNIQVLKELYALTNQIGYIVDYFGDGMPVLEEAFTRVKLG